MTSRYSCPKNDCTYVASAETKDEALEEIKEHYSDEHGEELPSTVQEAIDTKIKDGGKGKGKKKSNKFP